MQQLARYSAFQGAAGAGELFAPANPAVMSVVTGIYASPSADIAVAWAVTLESGGVRVFVGAFSIVDEISTFSWVGALPIYPAESLWFDVSGGSVDFIVVGFDWPYPTPTWPQETPSVP